MNQAASDLQKAIEDITKSSNADPVFADTVAGPAVPASAPKAKGPAPASVSAGPIPRPAMPRMGAMPPAMPVRPAAPKPAAKAPMPVSVTGPVSAGPVPAGVAAPVSAGANGPVSAGPVPITPAAPVMEETFMEDTMMTTDGMVDSAEAAAVETSGAAMDQVKAAALRDLAPLLDKMEVAPTQKFGLYKTMVEDLHDTAVLPSAYHAASEIADDKERGEALLYLVETIDKM